MSGRPDGSAPPTLDKLVSAYLRTLSASDFSSGLPELEVKFGTQPQHGLSISASAYDSITTRLRSLGFETGESATMLRVGVVSQGGNNSRVRAEFAGEASVAAFCKSERLLPGDDGVGATPRVETKGPVSRGLGPANFPDFGFRATLSMEKDVPLESRVVLGLAADWERSHKLYRYIRRCSLRRPGLPVRIDMSVVKSASGSQGIQQSGLFRAAPRYEVEIELLADEVGTGTAYAEARPIVTELRRVITYVLQGWQGTNYPVARGEMLQVASAYAGLLGRKSGQRLRPADFAGPSSLTLQLQNVAPVNDASAVPNVRLDYTVTDKADGDRKLLLITGGRVYMIDTNMRVAFTGSYADARLNGTMLDGEHIPRNRAGAFINLYAAFDMYFLGGEDVRARHFMGSDGRHAALARFMADVQLLAADGKGPSPLRLEAKTFYRTSDTQTVFMACRTVLEKETSGLFEYETDGLIFTPANLALGASSPDSATAPPSRRITWGHSFKWKPPQHNTIDFMVTFAKTESGAASLHNRFESGLDTSAAVQLSQYRTAVLRVGFSEAKHGFLNPCQAVLDGTRGGGGGGKHDYRPVQFFPTHPYDPEAGICHLDLTPDAAGSPVPFTESGELIEDNTIVEFRYDAYRPGPRRWIPVRVRRDKTAELQAGGKNFGNAYHVANSNWHTIHYPITRDMLATGQEIPDELGDDDVYYKTDGRRGSTRAMRDFHNLFVKRRLIDGVSPRDGTLVDLAVGKAGDLSKWTSAGLALVLGIDISRDNLENRLDGACTRFLKYQEKFPKCPQCLFAQGDATQNIHSGMGLFTQTGKRTVGAVLGRGGRDKAKLGKAVYQSYGRGRAGFDVTSAQFALHYMWETHQTLQQFIVNVTQLTKVGGCFIGTCFDGDAVFRLLASKKEGETLSIYDGDAKIWEITKRYDRDSFEPDQSSVGLAVDVYQQSINKAAREYLVNFGYLNRLMDNCGFTPLTQEEATEAGLPSSGGSFEQLYGAMRSELARNPRDSKRLGQAMRMSQDEKQISFMNRFFVYKRRHAVNPETVMADLRASMPVEETLEVRAELKKATGRRKRPTRRGRLKLGTKKETA